MAQLSREDPDESRRARGRDRRLRLVRQPRGRLDQGRAAARRL